MNNPSSHLNLALPDGLVNDKTIWPERYQSIVDMENHLHRDGTRIVKFFLHLSEEEQRKRASSNASTTLTRTGNSAWPI